MIVGEESQANSFSLTKHIWTIEIILSVLFEQRGPKRTKKAVLRISPVATGDKGFAQVEF